MDLLAVILFFWAWWLKKQPGTPSWLKALPWLIVLAFLVSLFGTAFGLLYAFHAVEALPASEKSTYLANGIARAMYFTAGAIALDAVVLVLLIILTVTRRKTVNPHPDPLPKGPKAEGDRG